jgi:hypothetical protein
MIVNALFPEQSGGSTCVDVSSLRYSESRPSSIRAKAMPCRGTWLLSAVRDSAAGAAASIRRVRVSGFFADSMQSTNQRCWLYGSLSKSGRAAG